MECTVEGLRTIIQSDQPGVITGTEAFSERDMRKTKDKDGEYEQCLATEATMVRSSKHE